MARKLGKMCEECGGSGVCFTCDNDEDFEAIHKTWCPECFGKRRCPACRGTGTAIEEEEEEGDGHDG